MSVEDLSGTQAVNPADVFERTLSLLDSSSNDSISGSSFPETGLMECLESLDGHGSEALGCTKVLLKLLRHQNMKQFPSILRSIIHSISVLNPDGRITAALFNDIVSDTDIEPSDVLHELEKNGYVQNNLLTPRFNPFSETFVFSLDKRFDTIREQVKEILLETPRHMPFAETLLSMLEDKSFASIKIDILKALSATGHPDAIPLLVESANGGDESAVRSLLLMGFNDLIELRRLLEDGITTDLWGNDLKEKVFQPVRHILPFFLDVLSSPDYSLREKHLVCYLYREMGIRRKEEVGLFVMKLPELMEDDADSCDVTRIVVSSGKDAVPHIKQAIVDNIDNEKAFIRYCLILGKLGSSAHDAAALLEELAETRSQYINHIRFALLNISPVRIELADSRTELGIVQEFTIASDHEMDDSALEEEEFDQNTSVYIDDNEKNSMALHESGEITDENEVIVEESIEFVEDETGKTFIVIEEDT